MRQSGVLKAVIRMVGWVPTLHRLARDVDSLQLLFWGKGAQEPELLFSSCHPTAVGLPSREGCVYPGTY